MLDHGNAASAADYTNTYFMVRVRAPVDPSHLLKKSGEWIEFSVESVRSTGQRHVDSLCSEGELSDEGIKGWYACLHLIG